MAFSMFLRSPGCAQRVFAQQQLSALVKSPAVAQRAVSTSMPLRSLLLKDIKPTSPILNSMRSFRTSPLNKNVVSDKPHDHAKLWVVEKATSGALFVLIPVALLVPNKVCDMVLAVLISAHTFWGFEAIAVDYVRAAIFGPLIPKLAVGLVYALSAAMLGGLFYIITHDIGLANSIKAFWTVKSNKHA